MAVTTEKSTEMTNETASPRTFNPVDKWHGRMRYRKFSFTQGAAAGDINSTLDLVRLPAGRNVRLIKSLSHLVCSAQGAARVLDVGYTAYTDADGVAVAASADTIADGIDTSVAASKVMGTGTNGLGTDTDMLFSSQSGVTIQGKVGGGTIPAAATVNGGFCYVVD